jgi:hypothetical protein
LTYAALADRPKCGLRPFGRLSREVATLKVRIESLEAELVKLEAIAAGHRADYERERDRADRLVTELLKATANTTREMASAARRRGGSSSVLKLKCAPKCPVDCRQLCSPALETAAEIFRRSEQFYTDIGK